MTRSILAPFKEFSGEGATVGRLLAGYANQLGQHVHVLGAERGAVVYMTLGRVEWVEKAR
jgi:CRISPR-associated exonuclease Cas4